MVWGLEWSFRVFTLFTQEPDLKYIKCVFKSVLFAKSFYYEHSFYAAYPGVKRTRTDSTERIWSKSPQKLKSEFRSAEENISKVGDAGFVWSIRGQGCPRQFREKLGIPEFG